MCVCVFPSKIYIKSIKELSTRDISKVLRNQCYDKHLPEEMGTPGGQRRIVRKRRSTRRTISTTSNSLSLCTFGLSESFCNKL